MANNSAINLESLMVNTRAEAVYAAQESSLYLPGGIIGMQNVPAGSSVLQVPVIDQASAAEKDISGSAFGADDFTSNALTDTSVTMNVGLYAARTILRDLGGIDPMVVGNQLGKSVAKKFDQDVTALFDDFTTHTAIAGSGTNNLLKVNDIFKAAATLRGAGVMGPLKGVFHPEQVYALLTELTGSSFAASDAQNEAMRNGYVGTIAGVEMYQSAYITVDEAAPDHLWNGIVFEKDAMAIGIQRNVDIEMGRRPEAVGMDVVASLMAAVGVVDGNRGIHVQSTGFTVET
jgi:hypothetical protein